MNSIIHRFEFLQKLPFVESGDSKSRRAKVTWNVQQNKSCNDLSIP